MKTYVIVSIKSNAYLMASYVAYAFKAIEVQFDDGLETYPVHARLDPCL